MIRFFRNRKADREIRHIKNQILLMTNAYGIDDATKAQIILHMLKAIRELEALKIHSHRK